MGDEKRFVVVVSREAAEAAQREIAAACGYPRAGVMADGSAPPRPVFTVAHDEVTEMLTSTGDKLYSTAAPADALPMLTDTVRLDARVSLEGLRRKAEVDEEERQKAEQPVKEGAAKVET